MSDLDQLYQQVILDHSRRRTGEGLESGGTRHTAENHQYNPTCGDEINVRVSLDDAGNRVESLTWEGDGCSISMASASVLSEMAPGMSMGEFANRVDEFRQMLRSRGQIEPDEESLGDAAAFAGVSKFVARVKCAMLAWVAAEEAAKEAAL
ncbi:Fe-S cluster assembly sulfur transfer protein SufU [Rothia sp. HC945]|uniref:Fe-S cluster assembly sulfur transfer protein SufU n=1 Tax=Rothia sp. HC945 TaxID=3171170 RepID=UPI00264DE881|nr:SUF system NifU family Fe-S cluster assembly protein [Kocuria sp.]MDN5617990.1 SUF system NifU family Fe-S cluster assembly protein [Kocuria sp.]MDN5654763.1 SUF system NifU family Fe-S cluster assembly protein [Kocuria sp.]